MRKTCYGVVVALVAASFFVFSPAIGSTVSHLPTVRLQSEAGSRCQRDDKGSAGQIGHMDQTMDAFFGKYLVDPVAAFAFYPVPYYDFSAGEWRPYVDPATAKSAQRRTKARWHATAGGRRLAGRRRDLFHIPHGLYQHSRILACDPRGQGGLRRPQRRGRGVPLSGALLGTVGDGRIGQYRRRGHRRRHRRTGGFVLDADRGRVWG